MSLSFEDAAGIMYQIDDKERCFKDECKEQQQVLKTELDGINSVFEAVLKNQPYIKLDNGDYLFLKESISNRALNEERIVAAFERLTLQQIQETGKYNPEYKSLDACVAASLEDNLDDECTSVTHKPCVAKRRPQHVPATVAWRAGDDMLRQHTLQYYALKKKLKVLRDHQQEGRKRCCAAQNIAEPVIKAYLTTNKINKKVVHWVSPDSSAGETSEPVDQQLPALPDLSILSHHGVAQADMTTASNNTLAIISATAPLVIPSTNLACSVEIKQRVYTSRGKAPARTAFVQALTPIIHKDVIATKIQTEADWNRVKDILLKHSIEQFHAMHNAAQGQVKEKLTLRKL